MDWMIERKRMYALRVCVCACVLKTLLKKQTNESRSQGKQKQEPRSDATLLFSFTHTITCLLAYLFLCSCIHSPRAISAAARFNALVKSLYAGRSAVVPTTANSIFLGPRLGALGS